MVSLQTSWGDILTALHALVGDIMSSRPSSWGDMVSLHTSRGDMLTGLLALGGDTVSSHDLLGDDMTSRSD